MERRVEVDILRYSQFDDKSVTLSNLKTIHLNTIYILVKLMKEKLDIPSIGSVLSTFGLSFGLYALGSTVFSLTIGLLGLLVGTQMYVMNAQSGVSEETEEK
mgnify:CR=1 FL=1